MLTVLLRNAMLLIKELFEVKASILSFASLLMCFVKTMYRPSLSYFYDTEVYTET